MAAFLMPASGSAQQPSPPYYSVQLQGLSTEQAALGELKNVPNAPFARAEHRENFYLVRIGVFESAEPARAERDTYRAKGNANARVVKISRAVPWILPDGSVVAPPAGAPKAGAETNPAADASASTPPAASLAATTSADAPATPDAAPRKRRKSVTEPEAAEAAAATTADKAAPPATSSAPPAATAAPGADAHAIVEGPAIRLENAGGATNWDATIVSLEQLGFPDGFTVEGDRGTRELYFPLPPGVAVKSAAIVLDLEFSELLIPESSLAFRLNGTMRRAVSRGETGTTRRVEIPLTANDLDVDFQKLDVEYSLFLNKDICFSRHLAGAYARISAASGLAVRAADGLPRTVRSAWSLLPREVHIAARLSELTPAEFQALFDIATLLHREGYIATLDPLADDKPVTAHIVLAPAERYVHESTEPLEGQANLRLVRSVVRDKDGKVKEERAFILVDSTRPIAAADMLRLPWRGASSARLIDVATASEWPLPRDPDDVVRLKNLGFSDSERAFTYSAEWPIALPFGPLGDGNRPSRIALDVYGPKLTEIRGPTVVSAYFNDRLVYSTALKGKGEKEVLDFELPRVQLRARNNLKVLAQRDEMADDCKLVQAAYPLSISPDSVVETKPLNETPATFAELVPHQRSLELYVSKDGVAAPERVIPLLVGLGDHFWPDVRAPEVRLFDSASSVKPGAAFFVVGDPKWDAKAYVSFDKGRVRVKSNATGEPLMLLDFASDASPAVLQMVESGGQGGAWLRPTGGYQNVPAKRILFEDENVAFLGARGVQMGLRVGSTRDYRIDYPESKGWFDATGKWRTVLFVIAWLLVATLLLYLYLKTRRHRGE